jgi:hypothetical protein
MSGIEAWVTTPAGVWLAHLDRSQASPFRRFAVSRMRGADPGVGSLEYHLDNQLLRDNPGLLADGNLVWMRYRGHTLAWIIEERIAVLDESEHATDWVAVSGRGVEQLLGDRTVWPSAFSESALDPSAWGPDAQWYRVINRAAGEMLWDMIAASNPRFATQLVRGTIETSGADGWTQDFRFDTLLDVVTSVTAAYGDVDMDGLTFNYQNAPGVDRSASVIFEEGSDILRVERQTSDRDTLSWIVAEGVGEGVIAKLATATDATIGRRREGYLDAKDAGNLPLVQLRANAALDEFKPVDSIALEVTEERFAAFTDYDLWDTVRVIAPSRNIDELGVIVAMYLAEGDDERVRVGFDVNSPRQEYLLRLAAGNRSTAHSVGVRNRQPQGTLTFVGIADTVYFDSATPSVTGWYIPDRVNLAIECRLAIDFDSYPMPVSAAASGGGSTSGASSAASSASGGSSTPTSGASSAATSADESAHNHTILSHIGAAGGYGANKYQGANGNYYDLPSSGTQTLFSGDGSLHNHGMAHTHVVTIGAHSHTIAHTHDIDAHSHSLTPASTKEAYPASHNVTLKVYKLVGATWTQQGSTISGITDDAPDLDLTAYIATDPRGRWRVGLQSAAGQPNGGRIGAHLSGFLVAAIQSA